MRGLFLKPALLCLLFVQLHFGAAAGSKHVTSASTCPFRTINYITHNLPQQCLTSSRPTASNVTTSPSFGNSTQTATPASFDQSTRLTEQNVPTRDADNLSSVDAPTDGLRSSSPNVQTASTSETSTTTTSLPVPDTAEVDKLDDFPLENVKFLSFEEWKKQNLLKTGQSEGIVQESDPGRQEARKRPVNVHNTLDALGDDAEIDLDFSGFVPTGLEAASGKQRVAANEDDGDSPSYSVKMKSRGKEAGTTSKERFNYASFDCAANVLKTNPQAKGAYAVLGENKDSYMLNECSAENKFLILELCNDIQIDTIVLANFEFFSSTFRNFRVSVSDRYPVKVDKWKILGTFEARNSREIQAFLVENPIIWARYVRFEFLTHYGNEFYCPVSLVRIHGTTMLEEYKHDIDSLSGDDEDEYDTTDTRVNSEDERLVPDAIADVLLEEQRDEQILDAEISAQRMEFAEKGLNGGESGPSTPMMADKADMCLAPMNQTLRLISDLMQSAHPTCAVSDNSSNTNDNSDFATLFGEPGDLEGADDPSIGSEGKVLNDAIEKDYSSTSAASNFSADSSSHSTISSGSTISTASPVNDVTEVFSAIVDNSTANSKTKSTASATQSMAPVPTMQESFFKSVQKRLQMLETNSSLSLQYIEEQSRALSEAFAKVEQRQLTKTTNFLEYLNTTVLNELKDFRQQYDQLWQSTVIELELQREQFQQETMEINARLGVLANEVIFQKRLSILQMILIVLCLGLVLFSRGSYNYLELPLLQSMLSRSPSARWMSIPGLDTPTQSPPLSRPTSSHQHKPTQGILKGHRRDASDDSTMAEGASSSVIEPYSPPTPVSFEDPPSDLEDRNVLSTDAPELPFDPATLERPSTSPPVLPNGSDSVPITPLSSSSPQNPTASTSIDFRLRQIPSSSPDEGKLVKGPQESDTEDNETPHSRHLTWQLPEG